MLQYSDQTAVWHRQQEGNSVEVVWQHDYIRVHAVTYTAAGFGAAARSEIGGKGCDGWWADPRSEVSKVLLVQRGRGGTDRDNQKHK
jgi:hypothetical protein